ncbi:hypothetical protein [Corynebacterium bovis]|uniref:Uncharacterized protein n=1 Tax=Corynebacterium bovis DSM 20582 = CIP 54.80 TaxID=927655 RepID=A0A8I0CP87_9CORY|nr:hypothetical protein [Corynebacterium bovis]MBB3115711.1 hypothetical protein [Corynebacterium bovis DSM 20582 = CIP 54.80]QQC47396.1 hypothetical protein I6I09_10455 [Corynebacterium bovis]WJY77135.1 hypothetical protein CBOVI_02990 [Corynebacterium bovis DSM 20582 = CIP 54.80]
MTPRPAPGLRAVNRCATALALVTTLALGGHGVADAAPDDHPDAGRGGSGGVAGGVTTARSDGRPPALPAAAGGPTRWDAQPVAPGAPAVGAAPVHAPDALSRAARTDHVTVPL